MKFEKMPSARKSDFTENGVSGKMLYMKGHIYLHERTLTLNLGLDMHVNVAQHFKMLSDTTNAFYSNLDTHKSQKISHFSYFFSPPVPCPLSRLML